MLPSWRNRLYIAIDSERISMLKFKRALKPKLIASYDEAIMPVGIQPLWQAVSDRLSQILAEPEWQKVDVNVVLSNRLVRYAVMQFNAQLQNHTEQEAFARHILAQTYGGIVEQWSLRIQRGKADSPWLISAIDLALLEKVRQACNMHNLKLCSVMPYLMPVYNRFRNAFKSDPVWLIINEPGYSLFAHLSGGEFIAINGIYHDSLNDLPLLLDRENLVNSQPEPCKSVYLYTSVVYDPSTMQKSEYEFNILDMAMPDEFPLSTEGLYAMGMSGVM